MCYFQLSEEITPFLGKKQPSSKLVSDIILIFTWQTTLGHGAAMGWFINLASDLLGCSWGNNYLFFRLVIDDTIAAPALYIVSQ